MNAVITTLEELAACEPGLYFDKEGMPWFLSADGDWFDRKGRKADQSPAWDRVPGDDEDKRANALKFLTIIGLYKAYE